MNNKLFYSVISQGLISAYNFGISIYLIRQLTFTEFGVYSLIFALGLTLSSFQNSIVITPMSIRTKSRVATGLSKYSNFYNSIEIIYILCVLLIAAVVAYIVDLDTLILSMYLASYCIREYVKSIYMIDYKVLSIFLIDVFMVTVTLILFAVNEFVFFKSLNSELVLFLIGISSSIVSFLAIMHLRLGVQLSIIKVIKFYKYKIWNISCWASIGVVITEVHSRMYILILNTFYNSEVLGLVQAARVIFGPMNVLINGWIRVARNFFANLFGHREYTKFHKFFSVSIAFVILINIVVFVFTCYLWDMLKSLLFDKSDVDMFLTVSLWALCILIIQLRIVVSTALQAMDVFKMQMYFNIFAVLVSLISIILIYMYLDWKYIPISIASGELALFLISLFYLFAKKVALKNE
ncbi:lipopolysaccharide biosynthesis protein [Shewanella gaetbuli]